MFSNLSLIPQEVSIKQLVDNLWENKAQAILSAPDSFPVEEPESLTFPAEQGSTSPIPLFPPYI